MWTFRVAVVFGGRGVDANLRFLQVLKGGWRIVERVALPNCARKRRGVVQFPWELVEGSAWFGRIRRPSVVVRLLFRNASLVGYPRFFVSQARVFVVLGVLFWYLCCTVEVCVVFLDTLTPEFELYVRLRERRQWGSDFPEFVLLSLLFDFFLVERQLDLSSVTARLRGCSCVVLSGLDIGLISQQSVPVWWRRSLPTRALLLVVVREFVTRGRGLTSSRFALVLAQL
ncbi:hypothetical protein Taro_029618 [Colocasia esculenta]|uniref:Uncharacterized protein n=1 Tax=Colocasia esculenta TaxID=4460 RepID=A0A843VTR8_COLES|nr:hypothetical protein [Colocasia esculenta]